MACADDCTCGACVPSASQVVAIDNRPSLPDVAFRHGTFAQVRERILADVGLDPVLSRLSTRRSDDHLVAAIELWSVVSDVLDFYGERYINEAYLGTASQFRSVERLARLVGYRPRPGVAALAWLAFTLEAGTVALLPAGVPVQSVPGPATDTSAPAPPVTFETLDDLAGDARWNAITAYLDPAVAPPFTVGQVRTVLDRAEAPARARALHPNDTVVLWGAGGVEEKTVARVDIEADRAVVEWTTPVAGRAGNAPSAARSRRVLRVFGSNAPDQSMVAATDASAVGGIAWTLTPTTGFTVAAGGTTLDFDGKVDDLEVGSQLLVAAPGHAPMVAGIVSTASARATMGPLSADVTRVTLDTPLVAHDVRTVRVHALIGSALSFWGADYPAHTLGAVVYVPVWSAALPDGRVGVEIGRSIQGSDWVPGQVLDLDTVDAGRRLLVAWAGADLALPPGAQVAALERRPVLPAFDAEGFAHLELDLILESPPGTGTGSGSDWPATPVVTILGNVARASHGQTVREVVGNGDGTAAFQRIALQHNPVTYLPAKVPGGIVSTLVVAVDGVQRPEVATLYEQPPAAAVVATQSMPGGTVVVEGGDGVSMAARFTSGVGNITARYRVGSGLSGRVDAERLTTLLHPPVGVRSVRNPLASEGGADAESMEGARGNAPASVRTLGRVVSLRDVEDLVLANGLVAKAQAVWVWSGFDRMIHLTVAAPDGGALSADLRDTIGAGLDAARDTSHRLRVDDRALVPITCSLSVVIDRRADRPDLVLAASDATVRARLGFDAVGLGHRLAVSDLIAAAAVVPGVVAVDVHRFSYADAAGFTATELAARGVEYAPDGSVAAVQARLRFYTARSGPTRGSVLPAELATVNVASDIQVIDGGRA